MPLTPNRSYPYPASTDHDRIWEHFENLADGVDTDVAAVLTATSASGAAVATASTNFTISSAIARTMLGGKIVYVVLAIGTTNTLTASGGNINDPVIATINNAAYRPDEVTNATYSGNPGTGEAQLNADGTIVLRTLDVNISGGGTVRMAFQFIKA